MSDPLTDAHFDWASRFCRAPAGSVRAGPADVSFAALQIAIDPQNASIAPGRTLQFGATTEADGTTRIVSADVTWTSSDTAVTIDAHGLATAAPASPKAATRVTITATLSGASASTTVTVLPTQPPAAVPLQSIVVVPAKATLFGSGIGGARQGGGGGQKPAPLPLVARGTRADGSSAVLTTGIAWTSSAPDLVAVDQNGVATAAGGLPGTATITATDTASGAFGPAIGGSATIVVEVPVVVAIEIDPAKPGIDLGEERQFGITRRFSDESLESIGGGDGSVDWSSDSAALTIDSNGSARAVGIGKATLKAIDATSGKTATLSLALDGEIAADTFAGTFTYAASRHGKVAPLLKAAIAAFDKAETAANELSKLYGELTAMDKQIGSLDEITKEIDANTSHELKGESFAPTNAGVDLKMLSTLVASLQENLRSAQTNFTIGQDDLKGALKADDATALLRKAAAHAQRFQNDIRIAADLATAIATESPAALLDVGSALASQLQKDHDDDAKKGRELEDEAHALAIRVAEQKLAAAAASAENLKGIRLQIDQTLQEAKENYDEEWKFVRNDYDEAAGEKNFQFSKLKEATDKAAGCLALGATGEAAANAAHVAASALTLPGEAAENWMADVQEDQRIVKAFLDTTAEMAAHAKARAQHAENLLKIYATLRVNAQHAIFKAPGTARKRR